MFRFSQPVMYGAAVLTVVSAACSQPAIPTSPTALVDNRTTSVTGAVQQHATSSTVVMSIPVAFTIQPSAGAWIAACVGEAVAFEGTARVVAHQTEGPDGSILLDNIHFNPEGPVAVGASTGTRYRLVGADSNPIVLSPSGGLTATWHATLQVIGPGPVRSFRAHILQHVTLTPDGQLTALVDVMSIDCR